MLEPEKAHELEPEERAPAVRRRSTSLRCAASTSSAGRGGCLDDVRPGTPVPPRTDASTVAGDPREAAGVRTGHDAVRVPLPGGRVSAAWGSGLHETVARLAALEGAGAEEVVAR